MRRTSTPIISGDGMAAHRAIAECACGNVSAGSLALGGDLAEEEDETLAPMGSMSASWKAPGPAAALMAVTLSAEGSC
jgi:hypothetical protein